MFGYDKDNIAEESIKKIQPYIDNESFQPAAIAKVSKACTSICQWVRAMHKYHFVAKGVAPKREALRIATAELEETQKILDKARRQLQDVEDGIATLQAKFEDCVRKKEELEFKTGECEARLVRADKVCLLFPTSGNLSRGYKLNFVCLINGFNLLMCPFS